MQVFRNCCIALTVDAMPVHFISLELLGNEIETIETVLGRDPKNSAMVDEQPVNLIIAQAGGILRIMSERLELSGFPVQSGNPVTEGADPNDARAVFHYGNH